MQKKYRLSYTERAEKIVSKLSLEEKVSLMGGRSGQMESPANPQDDHYNYTPYPPAVSKGKEYRQ